MLQLVLAIEQALGGVADKAGEGVCEVEGLVEAVGLLLCPRASCGLGWGQELLEKYQPEAWRPRGTQRVYDRPSERTLVMLKKTPRSL